MSQLYSITVPANGALVQAITGRELRIKDSDGPLSVQWMGRDKTPVKRGSYVSSPTPFTRLTFFNDSASAIDLSYYAGDSVPQDTLDTESTPASSKIRSHGGTGNAAFVDVNGLLSLNDGQSIPVLGVDSLGRRRRHIVVTNLSDSLNLTIKKDQTAGSYRIATVFPLTAWILETDADLAVWNSSGSSPISCQVLETFYTEAATATES